MSNVSIQSKGAGSSSSIVGSGNVGSSPITYRGITFTSMEHPSTFAIGEVELTISSQKLPGGGLVTNGFGPHLQPITMTGTLYQGNVKTKMALLLAYAGDGQEGGLSWSDQSYYARCSRVTPAYMHEGRAGFTIAFVVTRSANGALVTATSVDPDQSLDDALSTAQDQLPDLYSAAVSIPQQAAVSSVDTALQNAVSIRSTTGSVSQAPLSSLSALAGGIGTALTAAQSLGTLMPGVSAGAIAATRLTGLLTIAQAVTTNGQTTSSVSLRGGNLFQLAAQNGDVTQAFSYMAANGLGSPFLPSGVTTTINTLGSIG